MNKDIHGFHAHVYYDADTIDIAREVCEAARNQLPVEMGRMHEKPVGPHPAWSCQLAFAPEAFADVVTWLAMNRRGLTVFTHLETGDELVDHRDHAIWMGSMPALKLDMFEK
ncbi:DOPA 4,5-dioxygenase family protein [Phaeobacter sp. 22II1-1F12B]|uniref:DOPA 4,5-dioxygenase family protein n=1 Tax=Phaeobacter sp. 22II1-1F12B TaxID=1317111 RepID=UPI000B5236BA|nr:DOPA 4,5-dioxygenase family protein [Phaeobacter sp. 22II1-1F12B]OWU81060.1 4,5-dioxygenase [Phaeobacter sp. 22II1-1F12B]